MRTGSQVQVAPPPSGGNVRYGAIISYYSNGNKYYHSRYGSNTLATARNLALRHCDVVGRSRCEFITSFTNCASLAWSADRSVQAYGTGNTETIAKDAAKARCSREGGSSCTASRFACNTPVTSQASKSGGHNNTPSAPAAPSGGNVRYGAVYSYTHIQIDTLKVFGIDDTRYYRRGIVTNKDSEEEARREGLAACQVVSDTEGNAQSSSGSCRIEDTFTNCVAIAEDLNHSRLWRYGVFGYATANSESIAKSSAISQCERAGGEGADCDTVSSVGRNAVMEACNTPITPQAPKTGRSPSTPSQPTPAPPSDSNVKYGVVYSIPLIHRSDYSFGLSERSFDSAAEAAGSICDDCRVAFIFTNCAAVASENGERVFKVTWATGNTLDSAKSSAIAHCERYQELYPGIFGDDECTTVDDSLSDIGLSPDDHAYCHTPVTPQTPKVGPRLE